MNVIIDSGNPGYFETRAHELIEEAKVERMGDDQLLRFCRDQYRKKLIKAVRMLILAIIKNEE